MRPDRLLAIATAWFDAATIQRVFEPCIADLQHELQDSRGYRRLSLWTRGTCHFSLTFLTQLLRDQLRPLPSGLGGTAFLCIELCACVGVLLFFVATQLAALASGLPRIDALTPALGAAAPFGIASGSFVMLRYSERAPAEVRRALLRVTIIELALIGALVWQ
jgi:hypothetical protein